MVVCMAVWSVCNYTEINSQKGCDGLSRLQSRPYVSVFYGRKNVQKKAPCLWNEF